MIRISYNVFRITYKDITVASRNTLYVLRYTATGGRG